MIENVHSTYRDLDQSTLFDVLSSSTLKRVDQMAGDQLARFKKIEASCFKQDTDNALDLAGNLITQAIVISDLTSRLVQRAVTTQSCADHILFLLKNSQDSSIDTEAFYSCLCAAHTLLRWHSENKKDSEVAKRDILITQWIASARPFCRLQYLLSGIPLLSTEALQNSHFDETYAHKMSFKYKVKFVCLMPQHTLPYTSTRNVMKMEYAETVQVVRFSLIAKYLTNLFENHYDELDDSSNLDKKQRITGVVRAMINTITLQSSAPFTDEWNSLLSNVRLSIPLADLRALFFIIVSA